MKIIPLEVNDRLQMKKKHPCGSDIMIVLRVGSDIRIRCEGCERDITLPRVKLEKSIRSVITGKSTVGQ